MTVRSDTRYDFLRRIPLFAELPEADLLELARTAEEIDVAGGEMLFEEGAPGERAYVIERGQLEIVKTSGGREVLLDVRRSGEIVGEMALLESSPRMASVRARDDTRLLAIHQERLEHILATSPAATRAMLSTVLRRLRNSQAMLYQSEKMAHLGSLSAGVTHELNNPASAVRRAGAQLREAFGRFGRTQRALAALGPAPEGAGALEDAVLARAERAGAEPPSLSVVERCDREGAISDWLDDAGVEDGWRLASMLVELDLAGPELAALRERVAPSRLHALLEHADAVHAVHGLLGRIDEGAERIARTVQALGSYSYLDRAPMQDVDVRRGLDDTLLVLGHKLRGVEVRRDYLDDLPTVEAYGGELNQVFTNLIDNAADALAGGGTLTVRTRREPGWLVVEIEDDGPGVAEEHRGRVFDPFFTTKPQGEGTGLGLAIAYKIVALQHRGDLRLVAEPGRTRFAVWLPLRPG